MDGRLLKKRKRIKRIENGDEVARDASSSHARETKQLEADLQNGQRPPRRHVRQRAGGNESNPW